MVFNGNSTGQDCVSEILKICGATINSYPLNDITRRFNFALDRYFQLAFESDAQWPFDDSNYSGASIKTQTLVSGTNSYKLGTFTGTAVNILKVAVLDSNGNSHELDPEKFKDVDFDNDYATSTTGNPTNYTLYGDFIYLRPTPNYTLASALRLFVERVASYMISTDTSKEPGIPLTHHNYLCRYAALPYLIENKLPQQGAISQQITIDENQIKRDLSRHNKQKSARLEIFKQDNR